MTTRTVGVIAFDDMEVLDYAGPYEVFNVAGELSNGGFTVVSIGVTDRPIGRGGFAVVPDVTLEDAPDLDVLVLPGGLGTRSLLEDARLARWIRETAATSEHVLSVCTGALLLGAAGLLEGLPATTHHDAYDELVALSPTTVLETGGRWVASAARIWTSAGVSAGIDASLDLVALLAGDELRGRVVDEMEWMWSGVR
jgi:transcriptional regulator GlxA family with amidase domain